MISAFRAKIAGRPCMGIFSKTIDSAFVEAAGYAGLDFIILDMEHGPSSLETIQNHVRAAQLGGVFPVVRVKGLDQHAIGSALDTGAFGIQVPNISTAAEAAEAVKWAKFHPAGMRGVCRFVRAARYGTKNRLSYFQESNETLLVIQVEGVEGVRNLDEIMTVTGIDIIFIGPYDLSQSMGIPGAVDAKEVVNLMGEIAMKAKAKGLVVGSFSDQPGRNATLINEGFRYIAYSVDVNIFAEALKAVAKQEN